MATPESPYSSLGAAQRILIAAGKTAEAHEMAMRWMAATDPAAEQAIISEYIDAVQTERDEGLERLCAEVLAHRPTPQPNSPVMMWPISEVDSDK